MQITARNIALDDLFARLQEQQARKVDIVVRATDLVAVGGQIVLTNQNTVITPSGVTDPNGRYQPLDTFLIHLAGKLSIPLDYLRKLHSHRPDIFDANVNGWLSGNADNEPDPRNFLFRGFTGDDDSGRVARGLQGDSYRIVDNLDVTAATLEGLRQAGVNAVGAADISDKHMYLRLVAPAVKVWAEELLKGYRSPFDDDGEKRVGGDNLPGILRAATAVGRTGRDPILNPGIMVKNSELGFSSTAVTPYCNFLICGNGQSVTTDVVRAVHAGSRQDVGAVDWSKDTRNKELALMTAKVRDSVHTFMSESYWEKQVAKWTAKAGKPVNDPETTIGFVASGLGFTDDERATIFRHFLTGGQRTAGGVMNAITSTAQTIENADRAALFEGVAVQALDLV
jgi:hypothetical protein